MSELEIIEIKLYDAEEEIIQHVIKLNKTEKEVKVVLWQQKVYVKDDALDMYVRARYYVAPMVEPDEGEGVMQMTLK